MEIFSPEQFSKKDDFDVFGREIRGNPQKYLHYDIPIKALVDFSSRYFKATIEQGLMPENDHLYFFFIYSGRNGEFFLADRTKIALKNALNSNTTNDVEKIMILKVLFILEIISFNTKDSYLNSTYIIANLVEYLRCC